MKNKQATTPIIVAGITRYMIRGADVGESVRGLTIAAMPIESIGSVIFEPISVPIATP
jgi:hypothetical protein